jgi:peroxiredoxin
MITALLILLLISVWYGLYQLVKQQGRILLRLDAIDQRLNAVQAPAQPAAPQGLEVGAEFPAFELPDLDENMVSLAGFRGKSVLLVHWNPGCGFCDLIAPDLARLQPDFEKRGVQLLILAHGDAAANRKLAEEHGLECPVLLYQPSADSPSTVPAPLASLGTPSAYLLDAEGRIARPLAVGSNDVPVLAQAAATEAAEHNAKALPGKKPLSASSIVRDGLKAGTPAPTFHLPDLNGDIMSLEQFRGRRLLLVFSDPHCGPCDVLAPQLAKFHQKHRDNGLALVMVGRGEPQENRMKAKQHGLKFPVVLQQKWKLSKEYGIFSTPVAFLVNEDGVIAKDVAIGADPILSLAKEGLCAGKEKENELSYR